MDQLTTRLIMYSDRDQEGWTTVRYGRGRRRYFSPPPPPPESPRYARDDYAEVRPHGPRRCYTPVTREPRRRRAATHTTRRVPQRSPGPEQYLHHDSDSSSATDAEWWHAPRWQRRAASSQRLQQRQDAPAPRSADPDFGTKVRMLHKIIKATYHLQKVSQDEPPIMIARMTRILNSFIKPSSPSQNTSDLIAGNAKNWECTSLLLLKDHYTEVIDTQIAKLLALRDPAWRQPFSVAVNWAKRNLGRRLQAETVQQAEALLLIRVAESKSPSQEVHPEPTAPAPTDPQRRASPLPPPAPPSSLCRNRSTTSAGLQQISAAHRERETELLTPAPPRRKNRRPTQQLIATVTETTGDETLPTMPPAGHLEASSLSQDPRVPSTSTPVPRRKPFLNSSLEGDSVTEGGEISPLPGTNLILLDTSSEKMLTPTRHDNTIHKISKWYLSVKKKWLILGDANVSRLPPHQIPQLQIDSFPGATFSDLAGVLSKTDSNVKVQTVILSMGIHNRTVEPIEISIKQLQKLLRVAKAKFGQAKIWVPLINFSRALPQKEKENLRMINEVITDTCSFISELPSSQFSVEKDKVLWSHTTARRLFDHWSKILK